MLVGIQAPFLLPYATPVFLGDAARDAESAGFHSIWAPEHVVLFDEHESAYPYTPNGKLRGPGESPILEPFDLLAFLAAATTRIRVGTAMCLLPQRNPLYTAKQAATLDYLSGGRLDLGIGAGWLAEEFAALNVPFESRGQRTRSYVGVLKSLWCDAVSSWDDEYYTLAPCRQYRKPVQTPHPPIHFGGESDAALRRAADLGQGWFGFAHPRTRRRTHRQASRHARRARTRRLRSHGDSRRRPRSTGRPRHCETVCPPRIPASPHRGPSTRNRVRSTVPDRHPDDRAPQPPGRQRLALTARLARVGEGPYGLAIIAHDLDAALERVTAVGARIIEQPPHMIVHPSDAAGVPIQLTPRVNH